MRYLSTRSNDPAARYQFTDILLEGLASDGGLYLPESYPKLSDADLIRLRSIYATDGYAALAYEICSLYIDDICAEDLKEICARAYTVEKFCDERIVPVSSLDSTLLLAHLSNGPTAAFKDMAMQMLGELFDYELSRRGQRLAIVGATSGDTGSAAEYAMRGRDMIDVFMLTPAGRMSAFQQAQMFSLQDPNIHNIALDGVFDDCQDVVKEINADAQFKARYHIGAVNSINWARLLAQICYYVAIYFNATHDNSERISICVPTGNFGNICAGYIAREMGIGIDRLIAATNENDVLDEFFTTGRYRIRPGDQVAQTSSPSMDIAKASNFERFVFDLCGRNAHSIRDLFTNQLSVHGEFSLDARTMEVVSSRYGFLSGRSTHADRIETIARIYRDYGVLIDPHTADGVKVALDYRDRLDTPIVVCETALFVKFAETMKEALGFLPDMPPRFAGIEDAHRRVVDMPNDAQQVKKMIADYLDPIVN